MDSNFHSALTTALSREQVARLYQAVGWRMEKCGWNDYEVFGSDESELVVEGESPILMHGKCVDVDAVLRPLRAARVEFTAELYGPDGTLVEQFDK